jgi:hypothetical protein
MAETRSWRLVFPRCIGPLCPTALHAYWRTNALWRVVTVRRQDQLGERTSSWASNLRHLAAVEPRGGKRHLVAPKRKKQDATMQLLAFVVRVLTACSY